MFTKVIGLDSNEELLINTDHIKELNIHDDKAIIRFVDMPSNVCLGITRESGIKLWSKLAMFVDDQLGSNKND